MRGREPGVAEEDFIIQPTVIELLYQFCNIPFKTIIPTELPEYANEREVFLEVVLKPSFVHPDCVMAIIDVFKEAIKAILFFSWDGYFSWKKGMSIPLAKDIVKDYVANNASTGSFLSLQEGRYICNFAARNNNEHLIILKDMQTKLLSKPSSLKELQTVIISLISNEISRQESEQSVGMDLSELPFKHNADFSEITKKGKKYALRAGQSAVMQYMAKKHYEGVSCVSKDEIYKSVKNVSETAKVIIATDVMRDMFRGNVTARMALLKVGKNPGTIQLRF